MTEPLTAETIAELERIDAETNAAREAYVRNPSDDAKRIRLEQANIALDLWLEANRTKLLAAARRVVELERELVNRRAALSSAVHQAEIAVICAASIVARESGHPADIADLRKRLNALSAAEMAARTSEAGGGGR